MTIATLPEAYETAFAVFSPSVQFVEWKMFEVKSPRDRLFWPYWAYTGERLSGTWRKIEGKRWIYAFRRSATNAVTGAAALVDEFFLDEKQQLHATPMDKLTAQFYSTGAWPERGKRGAQIPIGPKASFIRQYRGEPMEHYFFASRMQLPTASINTLQSKIMDWTPVNTFEPNDPNIVWDSKGDGPLVPVLDPITIATHLHAYFVAASDDLLKYLTPVDDPDDPQWHKKKAKTIRRQKKFLLAQLVDSVIDQDRTLVGNENESLAEFLKNYKEQVEYRTEWRNRWSQYLSNWLQAGPFILLADTHKFITPDQFAESFLLHAAHCHHRLSETPEGRKLLEDELTKTEKFPWVQKYVIGKDISQDEVQAVRKIFLAALEFLKEHAPVFGLAVGGKNVKDGLAQALHKVFGADANATRLILGSPDQGGWYATVKNSKGESEVKFVEQEEIELIQAEERELKPPWKGAVGSFIEGIEAINFAIAVWKFRKTAKEGEFEEKVWALIDLTGAGLDLTTATLQILGKGSKKTLAKLSFVSAVIDTVVGAKETGEALGEGKYGKALGSGIVTYGSWIIAVGILADSSVLGPIGMVIVGAGSLVKFFFRDPTDLEKFVIFSSFGNSSKRNDSDAEKPPHWYMATKKLGAWGDDYDEQLRAAVALLCKFNVEPAAVSGIISSYVRGTFPGASWLESTAEALRRGTIKMGWVPNGAKLHLKYSEEWAAGLHSRDFTAEIEFGEDKPNVISSQVSIRMESESKLVVQGPSSSAWEEPILDVSNSGQFLGVNKNLKKITLTGSLEVTLTDVTFFAKPDEDGELYID